MSYQQVIANLTYVPQSITFYDGFYFTVWQEYDSDLHYVEYRFPEDSKIQGAAQRWHKAFAGDMIPLWHGRMSTQDKDGKLQWVTRKIQFRNPCLADVREISSTNIPSHRLSVMVIQFQDEVDRYRLGQEHKSLIYSDRIDAHYPATFENPDPYTDESATVKRQRIAVMPALKMRSGILSVMAVAPASTATYCLSVVEENPSNEWDDADGDGTLDSRSERLWHCMGAALPLYIVPAYCPTTGGGDSFLRPRIAIPFRLSSAARRIVVRTWKFDGSPSVHTLSDIYVALSSDECSPGMFVTVSQFATCAATPVPGICLPLDPFFARRNVGLTTRNRGAAALTQHAVQPYVNFGLQDGWHRHRACTALAFGALAVGSLSQNTFSGVTGDYHALIAYGQVAAGNANPEFSLRVSDA
jgi:hypothetical protein